MSRCLTSRAAPPRFASAGFRYPTQRKLPLSRFGLPLIFECTERGGRNVFQANLHELSTGFTGLGGTRRNFYGMHNLKDGGTSIPEGMNWTRHLVGEGGYVFDWVRGDYGRWVVDAMDRGLIPCLRLQNCNGGCDPDSGHAEIVASVIREHLEIHRPEYANRLIYLQLWNEPGDARDFVSPERFADFLVEAHAGV